MGNKKIIFTALLTLLGFTTDADAARKNRNSGGRISANRSISQNVNVSGTTTTINATVADTTAAKTDYSEKVEEGVYKGKIAPVTDKQAERECTDLVVKALQNKCNGSKECKNPTEIYATLDFENLGKDKDNKERTSKIPAEYRETYCANFLETAVNKLWNSYDSVAGLNEENCNIALARSLAAEACYRELLANKNEEKWDERDASMCDAQSIVDMYEALTGEKPEAKSDAYKKLHKDDLEGIFSKVGKMGWTNITARIGRFADLNLSSNTDEYPRELVQLVNSLKSTGNVMCGPDRYTELYDTNFALSQTSSSIEKAVQEKGLLKGGANWILDQVGVVTGEKTVNDLKTKGAKDFIKDKKGKNTSDTTATTENSSAGATPQEQTENNDGGDVPPPPSDGDEVPEDNK